MGLRDRLKDSFVSIEKAERQLDYAPKFSNKEALIRNFRWYLDNLSKFENASGVSQCRGNRAPSGC